MTQTLLRRVLWKEYRTYRGFWIAMVILALAMQFFFVYAHRVTSGRPVETEALGFLALGMTVFYALGIGATIFNLEHEQGTWDQLRAWPSSFRIPWLGKLVFALLSFALLGIALFFLTRWIWGPFDWVICWITGFAGLVVLFISMVCSLLIRRPLLATFTAAALVFSLMSTPDLLEDYSRTPRVTESLALVLIGICGLLALAISYPLAGRWFTDRPRIPAIWKSRQRSTSRHWAMSSSQLARMGWLSFRQLGWVWLGTLILVFLVLLLTPGTDFVALLFFWPPVIGATLFSGDQSNRSYRFLAERGVSARQLWWQRQAIGLLVFLVLLSLSTVAVIRVWAWRRTPEEFSTVTAYVIYCVLAYAWGQMCSVFLRSLLISVAATFVGAAVLAAWSALTAWFHLPLWLALLIPSVGLWTASRVRTTHWILDRDRWRDWVAPIAVLLATASAVGFGFYFHRAYEIPRVEPAATADLLSQARDAEQLQATEAVRNKLRDLTQPFSDEEYVSLQQIKAEDVTLPRWSDLPRRIPEWESQWLRENVELLDDSVLSRLQLIETLHGPGTRPHQDYEESVQMQWFVRLLVAQGRERQSNGDLPDAMESYRAAMHACETLRNGGDSFAWWMAQGGEEVILQNILFWAADKRQTIDDLQRAIDWSKGWLGKESSWTTPVVVDAQSQRDRIRELPSVFLESIAGSDATDTSLTTDQAIAWCAAVPGERQRWLRLVNVLEQARLDVVRQYIGDVRHEENILELFTGGTDSPTWFIRGSRRRIDKWKQLDAWLSSTPLYPTFRGQTLHEHSLLDAQVFLENQRRATHVALRMILWRHQHGSYPATLQDLQTEGDDSLPHDILAGREFEYLPGGLTTEAARYFSLDSSWVDASKVPILASPEVLREDLSRYGEYAAAIRGCIYPLPPPDIVLRHEEASD